jgi:cytoskeleton protein RodZ
MILRRCREYHEISLEEASQTTKIGISYLKSLEDDQISGFANLTYLKGFLRIYATYLGLNADDMARMYDKLYGAKNVQINVESNSAKSARPARRLVSLQKMLLPAVLLLLILITAALFKRQPTPAIRPSQPVATPSVPPPVASVQPVRTSSRIKPAPPAIEEYKAESRVPVPNGSDNLILSKKPADPGKGFILKIRVTQNGNLNVAVDGSVAQPYELTVGDIIEWKAEKSVALDLSNAGGVDVELNGKPFKQLGPTGKPAYVVLDGDGIKP